MTKKFCMVTTNFNYGPYLDDCMRSIVGSRGFDNVDYVVMDGGSTDTSVDTIKKFAPQLKHWQSEKDAGMYHAIEAGFALSDAPYMGWLNSDDQLAPWALQTAMDIFDQLPNVRWITSRFPMQARKDGTVIKADFMPGVDEWGFFNGEHVRSLGLPSSGWIVQDCTFWRRDLWDEVGGGFDHALTLAGDFEAADALRRVERFFGEIPRGEPIPAVPGRTDIEPVIGGTVKDEVTGAVPLPRVYVGVRIPPYTDPDFHAADIASSILADGRASRLYRRLVRERRIAKDVVAYAAPLVTGRAFMVLWATGLRGTDPLELETAIGEELDALCEVAADEVERAVARSETQLVKELEQLSSRADLLSMHQTIFGDASHLTTEVDRLRDVTAAEVGEFAGAFLGPDNRAVLTYLPEPAREPAREKGT